MFDSDDREGASGGQVRTVHNPAVIPGGIYTRQVLQDNLNVSKAVFKTWIDSGLRPIPGTGTRSQLFFADDVLDFMRSLKTKGM